MREPLLKTYPHMPKVTMRGLLGIANAIEHEAVRRYGLLADLMERRGEEATADAFRKMLEEERKHVATVEQWAADLDEAMPPVEEFEWLLPRELFNSWDEVAGSTILTPYRAFAIAVKNEERAFSLYTYLASHAAEPQVRAEAEKLAAEELDHATLLRRWRRAAYHREGRHVDRDAHSIKSATELSAFLSEAEAAIAGCYLSLAERMRQLGDTQSALLILDVLENASQPAGPAKPCTDEDCRSDDPLLLLIAAQKPLEALSEKLEAILAAADEQLAPHVESALTKITARLARIALQIELREQGQRTRRVS